MSDANSIEEIRIEDLNEDSIDVETKKEFVTSYINQNEIDPKGDVTQSGGDSTLKEEASQEQSKSQEIVQAANLEINIVQPGKQKDTESSHVSDYDDDFEDETLGERLYALTEMFPESLRNGVWNVSTGSVSLTKSLYSFSRSVLWVVTTSAIFLAAAPVIENELSQIEEMNRAQQRQILLGPNASLSNSSF